MSWNMGSAIHNSLWCAEAVLAPHPLLFLHDIATIFLDLDI